MITMSESKKCFIEKTLNLIKSNLLDISRVYNPNNDRLLIEDIIRVRNYMSYEEWHTSFTTTECKSEMHYLGCIKQDFDCVEWYYNAVMHGCEPSADWYLKCLHSLLVSECEE